MSKKKIELHNVNISHDRLSDLIELAERARPFYEWVERKFQEELKLRKNLNELLLSLSEQDIEKAILATYLHDNTLENTAPFMFDGAGRTYPHNIGCYYFFAWIVRDAPRQRLAPLITKARKNTKLSKEQIEAQAISKLIHEYREEIKSFEWTPVREIIIDRLEGSRRSIKGHEKETIVRSALIIALQDYFSEKKNYGVFEKIDVPKNQTSIKNETYDVCLKLYNKDKSKTPNFQVLIPVKSRETEGGGHSLLFSRDIKQAIQTAKEDSKTNYVCVFIIAQNWSSRETLELEKIVDYLIVLNMSPNNFKGLPKKEQKELREFIGKVLSQTVHPK